MNIEVGSTLVDQRDKSHCEKCSNEAIPTLILNVILRAKPEESWKNPLKSSKQNLANVFKNLYNFYIKNVSKGVYDEKKLQKPKGIYFIKL